MENQVDQVSISWKYHSPTLLKGIRTLRHKEQYADVTLACGGKFFTLHKFILSLCSDYFESLIKQTSCAHPVIVLGGVDPIYLESLISYMYNGSVELSQSNLFEFVRVAELLRIKGLIGDSAVESENEQILDPPSPAASCDEILNISKVNKDKTPQNYLMDGNLDLIKRGITVKTEVQSDQEVDATDNDLGNSDYLREGDTFHLSDDVILSNDELKIMQPSLKLFRCDSILSMHKQDCQSNLDDNIPEIRNISPELHSIESEKSTYSDLKNCPCCDKVFMDNSWLKVHVERFHPGKVHFCDICNRMFKRIEHLKIHMNRHENGGKQYTCELCGEVYFSINYLRVHSNKTHPNEGTVPQQSGCLGQFIDDEKKNLGKVSIADSKKEIKKFNIYKKGNMYCCSICPRRSVKRNLIVHHQHKKLIECPHCPFTTWHGQSFVNHKIKHGKSPSKKLSLTSDEFDTKDMMVNDQSYECDHCSYKTPQKHSFLEHMKTHTKQSEYFEGDQILDKKKDQILDKNKDKILDKRKGQMSDKKKDQISDKKKDQFLDKKRNQMSDKKKEQISDKKKDQLLDKKKGQMFDKEKGQMLNKKKDQMSDKKDGQMLDKKKDRMSDYKIKSTSKKNPSNRVQNKSNDVCHEFSKLKIKSKLIGYKTKNGKYFCSVCTRSFTSLAQVKIHRYRHMSNVENLIKDIMINCLYKCEHCKYRSKTRRNYIFHIKVYDHLPRDICISLSQMEDPVNKIEVVKQSPPSNSNYLLNDVSEPPVQVVPMLENPEPIISIPELEENALITSIPNLAELAPPAPKTPSAELEVDKISSSHETEPITSPKKKRKKGKGLNYRKPSTINRFKCSYCDFTSTQAGYLQEHEAEHRGEFSKICYFCPYKTAYMNKLQMHLHRHTKYHQMKGNDISENSAQQEVNESSDLMSKKKMVGCKFCCYKTIHKIMELHETLHKGVGEFGCYICSFEAPNKDELNLHLLSEKHLSKEQEILIKVNGKGSKFSACTSSKKIAYPGRGRKRKIVDSVTEEKESRIQNHSSTGIDYKPLMITKIGLSSNEALLQKQSVRDLNVNKQSSSKNMDICPATDEDDLGANSELRNPTLNSSSDQPNMDNPRVISTPSLSEGNNPELNFIPINSHKKYKCSCCDFTTFYCESLTLHERKHQEEHPYHCYFCPYKASYLSVINCHLKSHEEYLRMKNNSSSAESSGKSPAKITTPSKLKGKVKYLRCRYCSYETPRNKILISHESLHEDSKKFSCFMCSFETDDKNENDLHFSSNVHIENSKRISLIINRDKRIKYSCVADDSLNISTLEDSSSPIDSQKNSGENKMTYIEKCSEKDYEMNESDVESNKDSCFADSSPMKCAEEVSCEDEHLSHIVTAESIKERLSNSTLIENLQEKNAISNSVNFEESSKDPSEYDDNSLNKSKDNFLQEENDPEHSINNAEYGKELSSHDSVLLNKEQSKLLEEEPDLSQLKKNDEASKKPSLNLRRFDSLAKEKKLIHTENSESGKESSLSGCDLSMDSAIEVLNKLKSLSHSVNNPESSKKSSNNIELSEKNQEEKIELNSKQLSKELPLKETQAEEVQDDLSPSDSIVRSECKPSSSDDDLLAKCLNEVLQAETNMLDSITMVESSFEPLVDINSPDSPLFMESTEILHEKIEPSHLINIAEQVKETSSGEPFLLTEHHSGVVAVEGGESSLSNVCKDDVVVPENQSSMDPFTCGDCMSTDTNLLTFNEHIALHHEILSCDKCNYSTLYRYKLQEHQLTHDANVAIDSSCFNFLRSDFPT